MTALPVQMDDASIQNEFEPRDRMPCDACGRGTPATMYVRVLERKAHSHLCDMCGVAAIVAWFNAGENVNVQRFGERTFAIDSRRSEKLEQVRAFIGGMHCAGCNRVVLIDDFDTKAKSCHECERRRAIESGEALADWKRYRDE